MYNKLKMNYQAFMDNVKNKTSANGRYSMIKTK